MLFLSLLMFRLLLFLSVIVDIALSLIISGESEVVYEHLAASFGVAYGDNSKRSRVYVICRLHSPNCSSRTAGYLR